MKKIDPQDAINRRLYEALIIYHVSCLNRTTLGDEAVQETLTNDS